VPQDRWEKRINRKRFAEQNLGTGKCRKTSLAPSPFPPYPRENAENEQRAALGQERGDFATEPALGNGGRIKKVPPLVRRSQVDGKPASQYIDSDGLSVFRSPVREATNLPRRFCSVLRLSALWLFVFGMTAGCRKAAVPLPPSEDAARVEAPGLHNVFRITDKLYSGSSPDGEEGFRSLHALGVRTVVSVDGARPDLERAHQYGLRYVHLPVGYDGISHEQALRLARAVRDLPGPVYIHCHHGKHRGPAAAAVVHLCLDESCAVETVVAEMRRAGTDPHYTGLYAAPAQVGRATASELDAVSADFPEAAEVSGLGQAMVGLDERWERLKKVRSAGWQTPANHPDIDPAHEALQLREQYREAQRLPEVEKRPEELRRWLKDAEEKAGELESLLRTGGVQQAVDGAAAEKAFHAAELSCAGCHTRYRDVPKK
jgi:protein tyrosine phosphatase (PTP) superfamily phosphohydrolase (DUF442 family)